MVSSRAGARSELGLPRLFTGHFLVFSPPVTVPIWPSWKESSEQLGDATAVGPVPSGAGKEGRAVLC